MDAVDRGRFPLGDDTSATITLPDGRKLGYAQFGCEQGPTIICLHGLPGSRFDFARSDGPARAAGARIIAVDRPGFGLSSPHAGATLLSYVTDIHNLTDALGLNVYAVLVRITCSLVSRHLTDLVAYRAVLPVGLTPWHALMHYRPTGSKRSLLSVV